MKSSLLPILLINSALYFCSIVIVNAQCDSVNINGDFIQNSSGFLAGTYSVSGTFHIKPGVTIFIEPYSSGGCGELVVYANSIKIEGNIIGDFAGYKGGNGGGGGTSVTSATGDEVSLYDCSNTGNTGQLTVGGGKGGNSGIGPGRGQGGANGQNGSGPKQQCGVSSDDFGMIGSGGGGGSGGGAAYGGNGNSGGSGGAGINTYSGAGIFVSPAFPIVAGNGGAAGTSGNTYGTTSGSDIAKGSGGGGAGGGGRSYDGGVPGNKGGAGGGMVRLVALDSMIVTGIISVNGENGGKGGDGGVGGISIECCSDNCDDCGEKTFSCGSGGGSGAGGGSGGGILIYAGYYLNLSGALSANGGDGGNMGLKGTGATCNYIGGTLCGDNQSIASGDGNDGKAGGGGGGGRIKVFYPECPENNVTPLTTLSGGDGYSGNAANGTYNTIGYPCSASIYNLAENVNINMKLYPNPADEAINISWDGSNIQGIICIQIVSVLGQTIIDSHRAIGKEGFAQINTSALPSGIYLCKIDIGGIASVKMFAKI